MSKMATEIKRSLDIVEGYMFQDFTPPGRFGPERFGLKTLDISAPF
jgi:hypothetical protein